MKVKILAFVLFLACLSCFADDHEDALMLGVIYKRYERPLLERIHESAVPGKITFISSDSAESGWTVVYVIAWSTPTKPNGWTKVEQVLDMKHQMFLTPKILETNGVVRKEIPPLSFNDPIFQKAYVEVSR